MNSVCHFCTDRKVGCHSTCEKYIEETQDNEKINKERRKQSLVNDWHVKSIAKQKKKKHVRVQR